MHPSISETDLQAFIDGQIDQQRRFEVMEHISKNPELAVQVMEDLAAIQGLKMLHTSIRKTTPHATIAAARKLEQSLYLRSLASWTSRAAGVVLVLGVLSFLHLKAGVFELPDETSGRSAFVADAVHAYRAQLLLAQMPSMARTTPYNSEEIRTATNIVMPPPLPGLELTNVQLVPTGSTAGIDAMFKTASDSRIALFAVRTSEEAEVPPTLSRSETETTVYWQRGSLLYALTGTDEAPVLQRMAANFAKESE